MAIVTGYIAGTDVGVMAQQGYVSLTFETDEPEPVKLVLNMTPESWNKFMDLAYLVDSVRGGKRGVDRQ